MQIVFLQVTLFAVLIVSLIVPMLAMASATRVDGQTYALSGMVWLNRDNAQLSQVQINQFAKKTTSLIPPPVGFKPLKTDLKNCTDFRSKSINIQHLARPMFVIGDDVESMAWLEKYKPVLIHVGAIGLIIKAKSMAALKRIRAQTGNLLLYPANGNALSKMFGISCYPVLISKNVIEH